MYRYYSGHFQKYIEVISPGEYYATDEDIIISTVLGSCIAVTLYDPKLSLGGINHYMLPGSEQTKHPLGITGKYGIHAMDLLYKKLMELGSEHRSLVGKIFGGGSVLSVLGKSYYNVPENNIKFAFEAMETTYRIKVAASDVGGEKGRKVYFFPKTGKVMVKLLGKTYEQKVVAEEEKIIQELDKE